MAGVSGGREMLEGRAAMARGAKSSRQAKPARRAIRNAFIVPVRERDCAGSGSAPDEFKLFKESCKPKWFLRKETELGGALGICYSRRTSDHGEHNRECRSGARPGLERGCRAQHDRN